MSIPLKEIMRVKKGNKKCKYKYMYIYKITNKLNNKIYIGQTSRNPPNLRWNEHRSIARNVEKPEQPISRAIKKYGENNFKFEVIFKCDSIQELAAKEKESINFYDCFCPKGYNILLYQEINPISEKHKKKMSKIHQGIMKKNNKTNYLGACKVEGNRFICEISKQGKRYRKSFNNEIKAAIAYDKIALFLYGKKAKINFENKREKFLKQNLSKFFYFFNQPTQTSRYNGVFYDKSVGKWIASIYINKHLNQRKIKYAESEKQAAIYSDMMRLFYNKGLESINFKEKINFYNSLDLEKELNIRASKNKYKNVSFNKKTQKYHAYIEIDKKRYNIGYYKKAIDAKNAVEKFKKENGIRTNK